MHDDKLVCECCSNFFFKNSPFREIRMSPSSTYSLRILRWRPLCYMVGEKSDSKLANKNGPLVSPPTRSTKEVCLERAASDPMPCHRLSSLCKQVFLPFLSTDSIYGRWFASAERLLLPGVSFFFYRADIPP